MKKYEELQQEERELKSREEHLTANINQIQKIQEDYHSHFFKADRFWSDLMGHFHSNSDASQLEAIANDHLRQSKKIMRELEQEHNELNQQKNKITQDLDDLAYAKRKALNEEDQKNEY